MGLKEDGSVDADEVSLPAADNCCNDTEDDDKRRLIFYEVTDTTPVLKEDC